MAKLTSETMFGAGIPTVADLIRTFGGYWPYNHQNEDELVAIATGLQNMVRDTVRELGEFQVNASYKTASPLTFFTYKAHTVPIDSIRKVPVKYGDNVTYGGKLYGSDLLYGDQYNTRWELPLPEELWDFCLISDKPVRPSKVFVKDIDAVINRPARTLEILHDDITSIFSPAPGEGADSLTVWLYMPGFDYKRMARQYATRIPANFISPLNHLAVRAVHDSYVNGASELTLRKFISGATLSPITEEAETVVAVLIRDGRYVVVTDKRSYKGLPGDTAVVTVGQKLLPGDFMFDSVRFTTFENGLVPDWLKYVEFPKTYFGTNDSISIETGPLATTYANDAAGLTYPMFDVIARQDDLAKFWSLFSGIANTAAPSLTARIAAGHGLPAIGKWPTNQTNLPQIVDILSYLAQSWLRYGVSVSQIKHKYSTPEMRALLRNVGQVVPPWVSHIVQYVADDSEVRRFVCKVLPQAHTSVNTAWFEEEKLRTTDLELNPAAKCCVQNTGQIWGDLGELTAGASSNIAGTGSVIESLSVVTGSSTGNLAIAGDMTQDLDDIVSSSES